MNCENAREMILSEDSSDCIREHIAACPDCRSLAAGWAALKDLKPVPAEPSTNLDFKIISAANAHPGLMKRHRHQVLVRRFVIYATAASCALITWVVLNTIHNQAKLEQYGSFWKNIDVENEFYVLMSELDFGIRDISSEAYSDISTESPEPDISNPEDLST